MLKKIILSAICIFLISTSAYASDLSDWALSDFNQLSKRGILSNNIVTKQLNREITREEFCELIVNFYETEKVCRLTSKDKGIFSDTDNEKILKAYKIGVVSGKGDGLFCPDDLITRQEMATMISRMLYKTSNKFHLFEAQITEFEKKFTDNKDTDSWALEHISAACHYGIINGNDLSMVLPKNNASREQAICMLNRAFNDFLENDTTNPVPKILRFTDIRDTTHIISLKWQQLGSSNGYDIIVKADNCEPYILSVSSNKSQITNIDTKISADKDIYVLVCSTTKSGISTYSTPKTHNDATNDINDEIKDVQENEPAEIITPQKPENIFNTIDYDDKTVLLTPKEQRVFPDGHYFKTKEEALEYMTEVEVPVWTLHDDGTKTPSKKYITVNTALADDVIEIFTAIYNDESQFPIKNVGGFSWRNTAGGSVSQHSYGTCIDINWEENYYVSPEGVAITGTHWLPGEDPYSIAEDSVVVKTFAQYGWKWGGNAWGAKYNKDYMHFTFLGK